MDAGKIANIVFKNLDSIIAVTKRIIEGNKKPNSEEIGATIEELSENDIRQAELISNLNNQIKRISEERNLIKWLSIASFVFSIVSLALVIIKL